jgi:protein-tyrosine kinase
MDANASATGGISYRAYDRSRIIGAILVEEGRLRQDDVETIQQYATERGIRFGDAAIHLNLLTADDVFFALSKQFNSTSLPVGGEGGVSQEVVAAHDPQNPHLESLRTLRSQLMLTWLTTTTRKVLAIVSPDAGDGRTWLAANLATTFAHAGVRTLLIDTDLRRPRQHEVFNLSKGGGGLCELLTGRADRKVAQRLHPQLRLFVLPAGLLPPNPQELLARPVFDIVIDRFAQQFDLIILDTPPAKKFADAQIIAAHAGSAMLLARRNRTRHAELLGAMRQMTQIGVNVVGTVLMEH